MINKIRRPLARLIQEKKKKKKEHDIQIKYRMKREK